MKTVVNAHDYVLYEIAMNIGFNIRIQSSKTEGKDEIYTLKALLPYKITLTNNYTLEGVLEVKNIGRFVFTKTRTQYLIKEEANIELIDKTLEDAIKNFVKEAKISTIQFNERPDITTNPSGGDKN